MDAVGLGALAVALVGVVVAVVNMRAARQSADAARRSASAAEKSAEIAAASIEVAQDALRHERESEDRRARASVAGLVPQIKAEHARAKELSENVALYYRAGEGTALENILREKYEAVPKELSSYLERAESSDLEIDALRRLSAEDLEDVGAELRSILIDLKHKSETMVDELQNLQRSRQNRDLLDAIRERRPQR